MGWIRYPAYVKRESGPKNGNDKKLFIQPENHIEINIDIYVYIYIHTSLEKNEEKCYF